MLDPGQPKRKPSDGSLGETYRAAAPYVDAAWRLVGGTVVGTFGGYMLDRWLGTGPWLLVALSVIGMAAGFVGLYKGLSGIK